MCVLNKGSESFNYQANNVVLLTIMRGKMIITLFLVTYLELFLHVQNFHIVDLHERVLRFLCAPFYYGIRVSEAYYIAVARKRRSRFLCSYHNPP
jgi:hypothetical protein